MSDSMNSSEKGRREFLKAALRTVLFGGFVLTGLHLADRPEPREGYGSVCSGAVECGRCPRLRNCDDSRAVRYKSKPAVAERPDAQRERGLD